MEHSTCFFIIVLVSHMFSGAGISTSIWLLCQAPDATAAEDPEQLPLYFGYVAVGIGSVGYIVMIALLTARKSYQKSMRCSGADFMAYINNYTSGLNAMLALGVQIAYVGVGDFATSANPFTQSLEIGSICFVVGDLILGSLISFIEDWQKDSKNLYQEMFCDEA